MAEDGSVAPMERKWKHPVFAFFKDIRLVFKMDSLGKEILTIVVPAAMAFAADPVASLNDTAFIGHIEAFNAVSQRNAFILFVPENFDKLNAKSWYGEMIKRILPEMRNYFERTLGRAVEAAMRQ